MEWPSEPLESSIENKIFIYLLYDDRRQFTSQNALTGYYKIVYIQSRRKFNSLFPCPEYRRRGMADRIIISTRSQSSHIVIDHGRKNIPKLRTVLQPTLDETKQDTDLLLAYNDIEENRPIEISLAALESNKMAIYLLYKDRPLFNFKNNLIAHYKTKHVKTRRFNKVFPYLKCCRRGNPDYLITTLLSQSSHIELAYSRANVLTLRTEPTPPKIILCLFCGRFSSGKHRNGHVRDGLASSIFSKPFPCQAYRNDSQPGDSN